MENKVLLKNSQAFGSQRKKEVITPSLNSVVLPKHSTKKKKRIGRGPGSKTGKTSTMGQKGQKARGKGKVRRGFEGGQMPLHRRVPKRGFTSLEKVVYYPLNLRDLQKLETGINEVDHANLIKLGVIRKDSVLIKILGTGEINKPLKVTADGFSDSAKQKIEKAGGQAIIRIRKITKEQ